MNRRDFLAASALGCAASCLPLTSRAQTAEELPPPGVPQVRPNPHAKITQLTHGPLFHWGAYYDQLHFDPTDP